MEANNKSLASSLNNPPKSQKKEIAKGFFNVLIDIPLIIKEKDINDRKQTINVFNKKRLQGQSGMQKVVSQKDKKNQQQQEKVGRIYINELWSEKFHKQVLKDSKIQTIVDRISKLQRENVAKINKHSDIDLKQIHNQNEVLKDIVSQRDKKYFPSHLMDHIVNQNSFTEYQDNFKKQVQDDFKFQQLQLPDFMQKKTKSNPDLSLNALKPTAFKRQDSDKKKSFLNIFKKKPIQDTDDEDQNANKTTRKKTGRSLFSPDLSSQQKKNKFLSPNTQKYHLQNPSIQGSISDIDNETPQSAIVYYTKRMKQENKSEITKQKDKITNLIKNCKIIATEDSKQAKKEIMFKDEWVQKNNIGFRIGVSKVDHDPYSYYCNCCSQIYKNIQYPVHKESEQYIEFVKKYHEFFKQNPNLTEKDVILKRFAQKKSNLARLSII